MRANGYRADLGGPQRSAAGVCDPTLASVIRVIPSGSQPVHVPLLGMKASLAQSMSHRVLERSTSRGPQPGVAPAPDRERTRCRSVAHCEHARRRGRRCAVYVVYEVRLYVSQTACESPIAPVGLIFCRRTYVMRRRAAREVIVYRCSSNLLLR